MALTLESRNPKQLPDLRPATYSVVVVKRLVWLFITLSILVHLGGYLGSFVIKLPPGPGPRTHRPVEVDLIQGPPVVIPDDRAPIRFTEAPKELLDDSLEALKKKADHLSMQVQRVKKEMKANLIGITKNRWQEMAQKSKSQIMENSYLAPKGPGDFFAKSEARMEQNNPLEMAPSTFGNQIDKQVELGNFTALNTDRHLYYTFHARVEEAFRPNWTEELMAAIHSRRNTPELRPKGGWATRLDVILNPHGKILKVVLLKSSGEKDYDSAAVKAFEKAGFIPHPPKGMVNEDGLIILKYLLTVY
jgi:TonB family protein